MSDKTLLEDAVFLHLSGHLEKAASIYQDVLERDPIEPTALHYYGLYLHQTGKHSDALEKLQLASALEPENAGWLNDLGNVCFNLSLFDLAQEYYEQALEMQPDDHTIWNNLGAVQRQQGNDDEAEASFLRAVALDGSFAPALQHLGAIYGKRGDKMMASHFECRAYVLPPFEGKSKEMLGISYYFLGMLDDASRVYREWLTEFPENPIALHMLAACSQEDVPARASDGYVQQHFDRYAETFDTNLRENLKYRGPAMIAEGVGQVAPPNRQLAIIDIGCGTGMCGPILEPYSRSLVGVDLSAKMLERAALTGAYNSLIQAEIGQYLGRSSHSADLIAAADTMIYFGDLQPVFEAVRNALTNEGHFVFTVEELKAEQDSGGDIQLHASGRYRHSLSYVTRQLQNAGMELLHHESGPLRHELGGLVTGILIVAQKTQ